MTAWLAVEVGCAECASWESQLLFEPRLFNTLEEAKAAYDPPGHGWKAREAGEGVYSHRGDGGIEIIPLPVTP